MTGLWKKKQFIDYMYKALYRQYGVLVQAPEKNELPTTITFRIDTEPYVYVLLINSKH